LFLLLRGFAILVITPLGLLHRVYRFAVEPEFAVAAAVAGATYMFFSSLGYTSVLIGRGGAAAGIFAGLVAAELHNVGCRRRPGAGI